MARRKTTKLSELIEFFFQRIDRRVQFGKEARDVILSWTGKEWNGKNPDGTDIIIDSVYIDSNGKKRKKQANTKRLSLLRGLVLEYQVSHLDDLPKKLENSDDFYVKDVSGNCMCGETFSAEAVLLNVKGGNEAKNKIYGKIKAEKKITARDSAAIGMDCYNGLPTLFEELHIPNNLKQYVDTAKKTKEEKLQEIIAGLSPEIQKKLEALGLDADTLKTVLGLEHIHELAEGDESGVKFDIDQRNSTNTFNWFKGLGETAVRENIREEYVEDLLQTWYKLNNAAHLLTDDELAEIMVYSHEFRQRKTDLLLAGVKQDLVYLSKLDDNHPHIKQYGKVTIDKHFTLPQTKYRSRKNLPEKTIKDVLEQEFVTRIEAMGVHNHFKDIIERRIAINRETCDKYGVGRTWDYIIKEIEPWFEKTKEDLHEDYKEWGKIVREHVFTKDEYFAVKSFLKRSRIGQNTPRENYLRNHHVAYFNHVAPEIITIGRKLRQARKLKEIGANEESFDVLKQEYFLTEAFAENFSKLTSIEGITSDKFFELMENTGFVEHKEYQKFRQKAIDAYAFGIVPKEVIAKTGKEKSRAAYYYKMLQKHGIHEQNEKTQEKIQLIKDLHKAGVIEKLGFTESLFESKYINRELEGQVNAVYSAVSCIKVQDSWEKISKRVDELNNLELIIFDAKGTIQVKSSKGIKKEVFKGGAIYYNAGEAVSLLAEKDKSVQMPKETIEKLKKIISMNYNRHPSIWISTKQEYLATPESIEAINERYASLDGELKQGEARSKLNNCSMSLKTDHTDLEKLFSKMPKVKEIICSKYPEYLNDIKFFEEMNRASNYKEIEDTGFVLSFDPKNSAIPKIKQEKSADLSLLIRQGLASQIKDEAIWKKEVERFYLDQILPQLRENPDIRKIGQGLGMQKKTGERVIKAYDSETWSSFKPEFIRYNLQNLLQGKDNMLEKAIKGEITQYQLPDEMIERFKEDTKKKRFEESDRENFITAISEIEQKVNDKLTTVYSIPYQLNMMLEKERDEYSKKRKDDDYHGGYKHSSRRGHLRYSRRRY